MTHPLIPTAHGDTPTNTPHSCHALSSGSGGAHSTSTFIPVKSKLLGSSKPGRPLPEDIEGFAFQKFAGMYFQVSPPCVPHHLLHHSVMSTLQCCYVYSTTLLCLLCCCVCEHTRYPCGPWWCYPCGPWWCHTGGPCLGYGQRTSTKSSAEAKGFRA